MEILTKGMNLDNLIVIIEIVSSVAVIISLIYVAKQLNQGAKSLKTSTRDSSFHSLMEWNYHVMSENELAWVFVNGCKDFNCLSEMQKPRFLLVMASFFKVFENIYLHYLDKSVDSAVWENNHKIFLAYFNTHGAQMYWNERKPMLHPEFVKFLEKTTDSEMIDGQKIIEKSKPELV